MPERELYQLKQDVRDVAVIMYSKYQINAVNKDRFQRGEEVYNDIPATIEAKWNDLNNSYWDSWMDEYNTPEKLYALYNTIIANGEKDFITGQDFINNTLKRFKPDELPEVTKDTIESTIPKLGGLTIKDKITAVENAIKAQKNKINNGYPNFEEDEKIENNDPNNQHDIKYDDNNKDKNTNYIYANEAGINGKAAVDTNIINSNINDSEKPIIEIDDNISYLDYNDLIYIDGGDYSDDDYGINSPGVEFNDKAQTIQSAKDCVDNIKTNHYSIWFMGGNDYRCVRSCTENFVKDIDDYYNALNRVENSIMGNFDEEWPKYIAAANKCLEHAVKMYYLCDTYDDRKGEANRNSSQRSRNRRRAIKDMKDFSENLIDAITKHKISLIKDEYKFQPDRMTAHFSAFKKQTNAVKDLISTCERLSAENASKWFFKRRKFTTDELKDLVWNTARIAAYKNPEKEIKNYEEYLTDVKELANDKSFKNAVINTYKDKTNVTAHKFSFSDDNDPIAIAARKCFGIFNVADRIRKASSELNTLSTDLVNDRSHIEKQLATILVGCSLKNILYRDGCILRRVDHVDITENKFNEMVDSIIESNSFKAMCNHHDMDVLVLNAIRDNTGERLYKNCFLNHLIRYGDHPLLNKKRNDPSKTNDKSIKIIDMPPIEHELISIKTNKLDPDNSIIINNNIDNITNSPYKTIIKEAQNNIRKMCTINKKGVFIKYADMQAAKDQYATIIAANLIRYTNNEPMSDDEFDEYVLKIKESKPFNAFYTSDHRYSLNNVVMYELAMEYDGEALCNKYISAYNHYMRPEKNKEKAGNENDLSNENTMDINNLVTKYPKSVVKSINSAIKNSSGQLLDYDNIIDTMQARIKDRKDKIENTIIKGYQQKKQCRQDYSMIKDYLTQKNPKSLAVYPSNNDCKMEYAAIIAANLLKTDKSEKTEEKISTMVDAIYKSDALKNVLEMFNDKELYNMATNKKGQKLFTYYNTAHKDLEDNKQNNSNISISSNKDLNYNNDNFIKVGGM